jgi:hypothetical protein
MFIKLDPAWCEKGALTMKPTDTERARSRRRPMRLTGILVLAGLASIALIAAGCGSDPATPGVAAVADTTTTTESQSNGSNGNGSNGNGSSKVDSPVAFSACMRSHGVPKFPDPSSGGGVSFGPGSGIDPSSPKFRAAEKACQKLSPRGETMSPAQQAKAQAQMLKFSSCMRSHGVPNFPDPQFSGGGARLTIGKGLGIDPASSKFKAAQKACEKVLPGRPGKGGPGSGTVSGGGGGKLQEQSAP